MAWVPTSRNFMDKVNDIKMRNNLNGLIVQKISAPESEVRPTSFQTNDFIFCFQKMVDTYGTPNYKEQNPAVPAIVSFPFLFGVMFGDVMHGAILTVCGAYLIFSKREKGTIGA